MIEHDLDKGAKWVAKTGELLGTDLWGHDVKTGKQRKVTIQRGEVYYERIATERSNWHTTVKQYRLPDETIIEDITYHAY